MKLLQTGIAPRHGVFVAVVLTCLVAIGTFVCVSRTGTVTAKVVATAGMGSGAQGIQPGMRLKDAAEPLRNRGEIPAELATKIMNLRKPYANRDEKDEQDAQRLKKLASLIEHAWDDLPGTFHSLDANETPDEARRFKIWILESLVKYDVECMSDGIKYFSEDSRRNVIMNLCRGLAATNPKEALKYASEHFQKNEIDQVANSCVMVLAKLGDIGEATADLKMISNSTVRFYAVETIARAIAVQNDSASIAMRWIEQLPNQKEREKAEGAVLAELGAKWRADQVLTMMDAFRETKTRENALKMGVSKIAAEDAGTAIEWANALPADQARIVQPKLAEGVAATDLEKGTQIALAAANSRQQKGTVEMVTLPNITSMLYKRDGGSQAAEWIATLPPNLTAEAKKELASIWYSREPENAKKWIECIPQGASRDEILKAAAVGCMFSNGNRNDTDQNRNAMLEAISMMHDKTIREQTTRSMDNFFEPLINAAEKPEPK